MKVKQSQKAFDSLERIKQSWSSNYSQKQNNCKLKESKREAQQQQLLEQKKLKLEIK